MSKKRPIDLTGDEDILSSAPRPTKAPKFPNAPSSSARSQASQLRHDDDSENEFENELDASQNYDASFSNYELYGEDTICMISSVQLAADTMQAPCKQRLWAFVITMDMSLPEKCACSFGNPTTNTI